MPSVSFSSRVSGVIATGSIGFELPDHPGCSFQCGRRSAARPPVVQEYQQVEDADVAVAVEARILGIAEGVATMHQDIVSHLI